jgi:hypothetical protein
MRKLWKRFTDFWFAPLRDGLPEPFQWSLVENSETRQALMAAPGVTKVEELRDEGRHTVQFTVWGGHVDDIAQLISDHRVIGTQTFGETEIEVMYGAFALPVRFNYREDPPVPRKAEFKFDERSLVSEDQARAQSSIAPPVLVRRPSVTMREMK